MPGGYDLDTPIVAMDLIITDRRVLARVLLHNDRKERLVVVDRRGSFLSVYPFTGELHSTTYYEKPLFLLAAPDSPSATALLLPLS